MLESALSVVRSYGLGCSATCEELLAYLSGPTYTGDTVALEEVLGDELLFLHEVAEACILKSMGYELSESTATRAYPDTYKAHLEAMEVELREAARRELMNHVVARCRDLESYLEDPLLPEHLRPAVHALIGEFCADK
uniref:Uncharacterized protein n=1 Tax=Thermofilum pendens TaxID=2269 RepID=A0A7C4FCH4_THEPE